MESQIHKCNSCNKNFAQGDGLKIGDEKFCNDCIKEYKHFEFYKNECGLNPREILEQSDKAVSI